MEIVTLKVIKKEEIIFQISSLPTPSMGYVGIGDAYDLKKKKLYNRWNYVDPERLRDPTPKELKIWEKEAKPLLLLRRI